MDTSDLLSPDTRSALRSFDWPKAPRAPRLGHGPRESPCPYLRRFPLFQRGRARARPGKTLKRRAFAPAPRSRLCTRSPATITRSARCGASAWRPEDEAALRERMIVCNSRMPGSLRLGDARERYGESRRLAKSNGCWFEGWTAEEPGTQRLWATRRSARLEERYGHNGCKVDDGSISPQGMPSRTLVAHRPTRMIHPRTTSRPNRSDRSQMLGSAGRCASSGWADNPVAAGNGTLWPSDQPDKIDVDPLWHSRLQDQVAPGKQTSRGAARPRRRAAATEHDGRVTPGFGTAAGHSFVPENRIPSSTCMFWMSRSQLDSNSLPPTDDAQTSGENATSKPKNRFMVTPPRGSNDRRTVPEGSIRRGAHYGLLSVQRSRNL
jgi:hypothetical protein